MLIIASLSQKGGVGKSTLARLIARHYAAGGWRVKIADFNVKQGTSTEWVRNRLRFGVIPEVAGEPVTSVKSVLKQDYDLMVMDGRPDAETTSADIAKVADLILIPTGVSFDDLEPQLKFANELYSRGVRKQQMLFVLNKTTKSPAAVTAASDWLKEGGYQPADTEIPFLQAYQNAQNFGKALSESDYPTLNDRAELLCAEIVGRIETLSKRQSA